MHTLRRIFIALFIVFAFALVSFASAINSNTTSNAAIAHAATYVTPKSTHPKVQPLSPPNPCTILNSGQQWKDPNTGETWQCVCYQKYHDGGLGTVCSWALLLPEPNPSTWVNLNSGLYMDVEKVSTSNGALIHQWTYTGANNQWWRMGISNYGGAYQNAVSVNSGKCLGVQGGSTAQGASILQWSCNGNTDQAWVWAWSGNYASSGWPIWNIVDGKSGMCLGISGASKQVGAYAVQWPCNGSPDQAWY